MKYTIAALAMGLMLAGCQQQEAKKQEEQPKQAEEQKSLIADSDKMAYALGADMANNIKRISGEYKALEMNSEAVKKGFIDAMSGTAGMSDEEIRQQIMIFQQKFSYAQQQKAQEDAAAQEKNNAEYLAGLKAKGFTATESGLNYKVLTAAPEGAAKPAATDRVKVHYTGRLIDESKFDSSVDRGQPFEFSLTGGVIQGWLEGVKLMEVGSKYQFVIPPNLGYGSRGNPRIPANSILVFDVELLEIVQPAAEKPASDK